MLSVPAFFKVAAIYANKRKAIAKRLCEVWLTTYARVGQYLISQWAHDSNDVMLYLCSLYVARRSLIGTRTSTKSRWLPSTGASRCLSGSHQLRSRTTRWRQVRCDKREHTHERHHALATPKQNTDLTALLPPHTAGEPMVPDEMEDLYIAVAAELKVNHTDFVISLLQKVQSNLSLTRARSVHSSLCMSGAADSVLCPILDRYRREAITRKPKRVECFCKSTRCLPSSSSMPPDTPTPNRTI